MRFVNTHLTVSASCAFHQRITTHPAANTIATKMKPMARGAKAAFSQTETWIVKSKMAVPINSAAALSLMVPLMFVVQGVSFDTCKKMRSVSK
jgi:hypothetical protein